MTGGLEGKLRTIQSESEDRSLSKKWWKSLSLCSTYCIVDHSPHLWQPRALPPLSWSDSEEAGSRYSQCREAPPWRSKGSQQRAYKKNFNDMFVPSVCHKSAQEQRKKTPIVIWCTMNVSSSHFGQFFCHLSVIVTCASRHIEDSSCAANSVAPARRDGPTLHMHWKYYLFFVNIIQGVQIDLDTL